MKVSIFQIVVLLLTIITACSQGKLTLQPLQDIHLKQFLFAAYVAI